MGREHLFFKTISFDTIRLDPNKRRYTLFDSEKISVENRVTELSEQKIIEWFISRPENKVLLLDEIGLSRNYQVFTEIQEPFVENPNKVPGDIDILCFNKDVPHRVIAIQAKRIKAFVKEDGEEVVKKISGLDKGISQARKMNEFGFFQTWFAVFIEIDAQHKRMHNQILRGLDQESRSEVYSFSGFGDLPDEVGILLVQINQTTGKHINGAGTIGICALKPAKVRDQSTRMTEKALEFRKNQCSD